MFAMAAESSVAQLQAQAALDLWLVTFVDGPNQTVIAAAGPWAEAVGPGTVVPWAESFCIQMVNGRGPNAAPRVQEVPSYAAVATANGRAAQVGAYVGVPLFRGDGDLAGTLCGFAGDPQPDAMTLCLPLVQLVGRLLSTILTREQELSHRHDQITAAQELAEQDLLTGLRNERGWARALAHETQRCRRFGLPASVVVLDVGDEQAGPRAEPLVGGALDALFRRTAEVLTQASRPVDIAARPGRTEFLILAVQCDARATKALTQRIRMSLRSAGIAASVGTATRRLGEDLTDTRAWAAAAMAVEQRRRRRLEDARGRRAIPYA